MDDALVPYKKDDTNVIFVSVLILVVMDDALVHNQLNSMSTNDRS